jgi:hypothetical protein
VSTGYAAKCKLTLSYCFSIALSPPEALHAPLENASTEIDFRHPLFPEVLPYLLQQRLTQAVIAKVSLRSLLELFQAAPGGIEEVERWIWCYFGCQGKFAQRYIVKLTDSLEEIAPAPSPFFALLFKAMANTPAPWDAALPLLDALVLRAADLARANPGLVPHVVKSLLQLRRLCDPVPVGRAAVAFLRKLPQRERLAALRQFFADYSFVRFVMNAGKTLKFPASRYLPLLSLFFNTINTVFLEGDKAILREVMAACSVLGSLLENFSDATSSVHIARSLFPLLAMMFTYYDSFRAEVSLTAMVTPLVLFLLKYTTSRQFGQYWSILSTDGQGRFLQFLLDMTRPDVITELAPVSSHMSENKEACSYEVTWRIINFLCFFSDMESLHSKTLAPIFGLLIPMLFVPRQSAGIFAAIFRTLCFFVRRFKSVVFVEQTSVILDLVNGAVPITQRMLVDARRCAIAFLRWLLATEQALTDNTRRCELALQFGIANHFFEVPKLASFLRYLPEMPAVSSLFTRLQHSKASPVAAHQAADLIAIADSLPRFASIRARIYQGVATISETNRDPIAAFMAQWRLCEIAAAANKPQPVPDEYGEDAFLVRETELFREAGMQAAMEKALDFVLQTDLTWMVSHVSDALFDVLERARQFGKLISLYQRMAGLYEVLLGGDEPKVGFSLVKDDSPGARWRKVIVVSSSAAQAEGTRVQFDPTDLMKMSVAKFWNEVIVNENGGWGETYLEKTVWEVAPPLPSALGLAEVVNETTHKLTREEAFQQKLGRFREDYEAMVAGIVAIVPAKDMKELWPKCPLSVDTGPLVQRIRAVTGDDKGTQPEMKFVREMNEVWIVPDGTPPGLVALARDLWRSMRETAVLLAEVHELIKSREEDVASLERCSRILFHRD